MIGPSIVLHMSYFLNKVPDFKQIFEIFKVDLATKNPVSESL
jgi:hypothetical protein